MNVEQIRKGIKPYTKEQNIILRALRMKGGMTSSEFDNFFGDYSKIIQSDGTTVCRRKKMKLRFFGVVDKNTYILGDIFSLSDLSKWLHLTQLMAKADLINISRKKGEITYETKRI